MKKIVKIVTFYEDGTFQESTPCTSAPMPTIPLNPYTYPSNGFGSNCPKCGLKLESVMGYVCSNNPCPTGLGGVTC